MVNETYLLKILFVMLYLPCVYSSDARIFVSFSISFPLILFFFLLINYLKHKFNQVSVI